MLLHLTYSRRQFRAIHTRVGLLLANPADAATTRSVVLRSEPAHRLCQCMLAATLHRLDEGSKIRLLPILTQLALGDNLRRCEAERNDVLQHRVDEVLWRIGHLPLLRTGIVSLILLRQLANDRQPGLPGVVKLESSMQLHDLVIPGGYQPMGQRFAGVPIGRDIGIFTAEHEQCLGTASECLMQGIRLRDMPDVHAPLIVKKRNRVGDEISASVTNKGSQRKLLHNPGDFPLVVLFEVLRQIHWLL